MKSAGSTPRFFIAPRLCNHRSIVGVAGAVVENNMFKDQTRIACQFAARIVIDDRSRLPGRFFGRFATSATSWLARAF
jgi:hypothetical protein